MPLRPGGIVLVADAFGNYRQLLEAVTLNPAMGYYLNTKGNKKEDVARNRVPDENYGREVMQLFTLGLYLLNQDGTEKRDGSGNRIETYTQSDITNIARVFTGWDIDQSQNVPTLEPVQNRTIPSTHYTRLPMALTAANHSTLAVQLFGRHGARRHGRRAGPEDRAGHLVQPPQRGAVLWQADDPAPGHQQPQPGLCGPRGRGLQ